MREEYPRSSGTVAADHLAVLARSQLAAVVNQEAPGAGELVCLPRQHANRQLLVGEVGAGKLQRLGEVRLVDVDDAAGLVDAAGLELLDAVLVEVVVGLALGVLISSHVALPLRVESAGVFQRSQRIAGRRCARPGAEILPYAEARW